MEIKYFVRTVGTRHFEYDIPYEILYDRERRNQMAYIEHLEYINEYNAVLMEDDLELCNNFKEEIERVIAKYPNKVINFFFKPTEYYTTYEGDLMVWTQCVYYPKGYAGAIASRM